MPFDAQAAFCSIKPKKRTAALRRRDAAEFLWAEDEPAIGGPVLPDTCVYLDVLRGKSPDAVDALLTYRICHHSAVCRSELTHVLGRLDPAHRATKPALKTVRETIADIPGHRLLAPDAHAWEAAGILAGLLTRLTNAPKNEGHERRFLNNALILLQAQSLGAAVLTANIADFDYLTQIIPNARVVFYRAD